MEGKTMTNDVTSERPTNTLEELFEKAVKLMVKEFTEKFNISKDHELHRTLIREETQEVMEAAAHLLKEICDLIYVLEEAKQAGMDNMLDEEETTNVLLAMRYADNFHLPQVLAGLITVHMSNMSKLDAETGEPIYRDDGKLLKGLGYVAPDLTDLV